VPLRARARLGVLAARRRGRVGDRCPGQRLRDGSRGSAGGKFGPVCVRNFTCHGRVEPLRPRSQDLPSCRRPGESRRVHGPCRARRRRAQTAHNYLHNLKSARPSRGSTRSGPPRKQNYNEASLELQRAEGRHPSFRPLQLVYFPVVVDAVLPVAGDLDPHDEVRTCGGFA
jgi:hypothetical protein